MTRPVDDEVSAGKELMSNAWQVLIYERQRLVFSTEGDGPLELGRQNQGEPGPFNARNDGGRRRVVVARLDEDTVSRQHVLVEPLGNDKVRVTNLSRKLPVRLEDKGELGPAVAVEVALPALLTLGRKTVRVQTPEATEEPLQALSEATVPPGLADVRTPRPPALTLLPGAGMEPEALVRWLQAALGVVQSAAGSSDFFAKAARAAVDLVGLDSGRVLLLDRKGEWQVEALHARNPSASDVDSQPSRKILARLREEKRTFWQTPGQGAPDSVSLVGVKAVVAAPILDRQGQVVGALYGDRRRGADPLAVPITRIEAMLVELLASGVAAGLARTEQERAAVAARVQFEQFFTPELTRHLAAHPDLLEGRDTEITTLFCDIRGFSRISDRLGPGRTIGWLREMLDELSACILDFQGVLVDYTGDEVMALWGAPGEQPDHACIACRAALAMLERLPGLNERWREQLGEAVDFGIGISTGRARVGNVGSQRKFKYGALGTTVNLGSRVQGATKYLKRRLLVTGMTHAQLGGEFPSRRLCTIKVVNIPTPVDLFEVATAGQPDWDALKTAYEEALVLFEGKDFRRAARMLGNLLTEHPGDGPSLVLLSRAVSCLIEEPVNFSPVWELPGK